MNISTMSLCSCVVILLLALAQHSQGIAVMSVDLGSEWMKIAIVSPGVPMEIALNKESKRKTPTLVAFHDGERTFGEEAQIIGTRFPSNSYGYFLDLLGKSIDSPVVQLFKSRFPYYDIVADEERGTIAFKTKDNELYNVEELVAMLLHRAREFASASAGQVINEAVLIVPGYFNQIERQSMLKAGEIAGLKVLQLMNDYTAIGLNYGIFRRKDFNETNTVHVMFYDMGAWSTTVSIVSYQVVKTKERGFVETHPQVSMLGVGFDRSLGGLEMQIRLRDFLGKKFNEMKKTTKNVFDNPRSVAKLFKEAGRLKNVLSANNEMFAQIEGLIDEIDFKLLVTRAEFEELNEDLFDRVGYPVEQALKSSAVPMDVINQVVLVGAGTRVPKVQEKIRKVVGMELSKNLNTDEAAAMGAVYKAADLSTGFKVKKFITKDIVLFPIQVEFERESETGDTRVIKRMLFGPSNAYPQKKILTFNKYVGDFNFNVSYASEIEHMSPEQIAVLGTKQISKFDVSGVNEAFGKHNEENAESKGIKAHFAMDESGILSLVNIELVVEKQETAESPLSKLGNTLTNLFSRSKAEEDKPIHETPDEGNQTAEEPPKNVNSTESQQQSEEVNKNATLPGEVDKKPKIVTVKEAIAASETKYGVSTLNKKQLEASFTKLETLNKKDHDKVRKEKALNSLESLLFDAKSKLELEEYSSVSTPNESKTIVEKVDEITNWLEEDGWNADADVLEGKLTEINSLVIPVWERHREHQERPEALKSLDTAINASVTFFNSIKNLTQNTNVTEELNLFSDVELKSLDTLINETTEWKVKNEKEQNQLKRSDPVVITVRSVVEKIRGLEREVRYLENKSRLWMASLNKKKDTPKKKEEKSKNKEPEKNKSSETEKSKPEGGEEAAVPEEQEPLTPNPSPSPVDETTTPEEKTKTEL
uniref:Hypoxia up-regulated protein 1 n=1 Tax=Cacopsylla melanoneura TaxID=428564 RepID=A0A8D8RGT5_9HEMI